MTQGDVLTKREATLRLLRSAIIGLFRKDEPLQVHLVAHSALNISHDIHKLAGDDPIERLVKPEHIRDFYIKVRGLVNFCKHADKEQDDYVLDADIYEINEMTIMIAVMYYELLYGRSRNFFLISFSAYMVLRRPQCFTEVYRAVVCHRAKSKSAAEFADELTNVTSDLRALKSFLAQSQTDMTY